MTIRQQPLYHSIAGYPSPTTHSHVSAPPPGPALLTLAGRFRLSSIQGNTDRGRSSSSLVMLRWLALSAGMILLRREDRG